MEREALLQKLTGYISQNSGSVTPGPERTIEDMHFINDVGFDSIDLMEMMMWIEDEFSIKIDDREFYSDIQTVGSLLDYLEKKLQ